VTKQFSVLSRRQFLRQAGASSLAIAAAPILSCRGADSPSASRGAAFQTIPLNDGWLFGPDDSALAPVTLPHCVARLSWQKWDPAQWQRVWKYRRDFPLPREALRRRVFVHFDAVMTAASPAINGHALPQHLGGYLPFDYEITEWAQERNTLAVDVDSRWLNVPPDGSPKGARDVDYLEPGGITRPVSLRLLPRCFISDLFAKPVSVLSADRRVELSLTVDSAGIAAKSARVQIDLAQGGRLFASESLDVDIRNPSQTQHKLTLAKLGDIKLWDVAAPNLYDVVATFFVDDQPIHDYRVRVGFREARFEVDGFHLNGRRLRLFGLNRHEIFPYVGAAMPARVHRRDAEILRHEFNCNIVRCSHYPQSEAFLDACDELGMMVWEEPPGWWYVGDPSWKELAVRDIHDMVLRDRNHPAIVIWGVRINEAPTDVELFRRTTGVAKALDDSRPASGSMTPGSRKNWRREWREDVFAFDDYHADPDGSVGIEPPTPGVPYMLAEAVGQCNYSKGKLRFDAYYRRAGDLWLQQQQALRHALAHSKAAAYKDCAGVIAWCGFDYASLFNGFNAVKCPGVADVFRIPKLGASFYQSQVDPKIRPVIQPNFYWDFGPNTPRGPGKSVAIFSNCQRLELFIDGKPTALPRRAAEEYPHLPYPPFLAGLDFDGAGHPELRIDGFVGDSRVISRSFSSNPADDQFVLRADDSRLIADGSDATRLFFARVDKFGSIRPVSDGTVSFQIEGPGTLVGDNPFDLGPAGGAAAVWIKTLSNQPGRIRVTARHSTLGVQSVEIDASPAD